MVDVVDVVETITNKNKRLAGHISVFFLANPPFPPNIISYSVVINIVFHLLNTSIQSIYSVRLFSPYIQSIYSVRLLNLISLHRLLNLSPYIVYIVLRTNSYMMYNKIGKKMALRSANRSG